jgi:hypothetical protein
MKRENSSYGMEAIGSMYAGSKQNGKLPVTSVKQKGFPEKYSLATCNYL